MDDLKFTINDEKEMWLNNEAYKAELAWRQQLEYNWWANNFPLLVEFIENSMNDIKRDSI